MSQLHNSSLLVTLSTLTIGDGVDGSTVNEMCSWSLPNLGKNELMSLVVMLANLLNIPEMERLKSLQDLLSENGMTLSANMEIFSDAFLPPNSPSNG